VISVYLLFGVMGLGYISRITLEKLFKQDNLYRLIVNVLVKSLYYFIIPLAFFTVFLGRGVTDRDIYILSYVALLILLIYFTTLRGRLSERMHLFLVSVFPNSVFLGFPLCLAVLGRIYVAAFFGVLTVTLNVLLPELISRSRETIVKNLARSTALIGCLTGIAAHYVLSYYNYVDTLYSYLWWSSPLLSYTATYVMGLRIPIKLEGVSRVKKELLVAGLYRFIVAPILAFLTAILIGFDRLDTYEFLLVSATPPAVMNAIVAEKYGWRPEDTALITALLTIFFIAVMFPIILLIS